MWRSSTPRVHWSCWSPPGVPREVAFAVLRHELAIARALPERARILVLDEPSLGLARIIIAEIYRTLARLREAGLTILLIEQAATTAIAFADHTAVLVGGRIVQGPREDLLARGDVVRHYLGAANTATGTL